MSKAKIFYFTLQDEQTKEEKLDWFERVRFEEIPFDNITPDLKANWINLTDNDFDSFLPLIDKKVKAGKSQEAVFQLFSRGIATQRDEWVYDFSKEALIERMKYLVEVYQDRLENGVKRELDIKWDRELEKYLKRKIKKTFEEERIVKSCCRPYAKQYLYFDKNFNGMTYQLPSIFPSSEKHNQAIWIKSGIDAPYFHLAIEHIPDVLPNGGSQCLSLYRYDENGNRIDNITDWALEQFRRHYGSPCPADIPLVKGDSTAAPLDKGGSRGDPIDYAAIAPPLVKASPCPADIPLDKGDSPVSPLDKGGSRGDPIDYAAIARQRNLPYKKGHLPYNPKLVERAKVMRKDMTKAEKKLWYDFLKTFPERILRQRPIDHFIIDFYCPALKLVIEVDGGQHYSEEGRETDAERTAILESYGLQVLRFRNDEVLQDFESVCQVIEGVRSPCPADIPLDKGDSPVAPLDKGGSRGDPITKLDIFHYTYAVLHHPAYRTQYELNLKREFPRLPFYADFHQWATWGRALMDLHLNYEAIQPYGLKRQDIASKEKPKAKLKADKPQGIITLDENTQLTGVPAIAWDYKLGNRSALEWILDQYKEKKPKDPTIAKLFNTYKFADYKEQVIDLCDRVCTVSVKTMEIIQQMPATVKHQG